MPSSLSRSFRGPPVLWPSWSSDTGFGPSLLAGGDAGAGHGDRHSFAAFGGMPAATEGVTAEGLAVSPPQADTINDSARRRTIAAFFVLKRSSDYR